jgi:hypothetical protein
MQAISWLPLGRWNYQPCCPAGLELAARGRLSALDAAGLLAFLLIPLLFVMGRQRPWLAWISAASCAVWLGLQLVTWWPPYIFGASDRWERVYARAFAQATQILPRWDGHLPPDAMHLVLQVLLAGTIVSSWRWLRHQGR